MFFGTQDRSKSLYEKVFRLHAWAYDLNISVSAFRSFQHFSIGFSVVKRLRFIERVAMSILLFAMSIGLCGCFGGPEPIPPPEWDPVTMAGKALVNDSNGDGMLDGDELDMVPGIKASMRAIDKNSDNKASREEIEARLALYEETRTGVRPVTLKFTRKGKPLAGVKVKMVPESFLDGAIEAAEGVTEGDGKAWMNIPDGGYPTPVVRVGFYKIEVTSDSVKLPAKYNTKTTLGFEVSPVSDGFMPQTTFELK